MEPTDCWRSSIWKSGVASISTAARPTTSPPSFPMQGGSPRESALSLSSVPVSAKARRQDTAVQHDPPSVEAARSDGLLARALAERGRRSARNSALLRTFFRPYGRRAVADAADG